MSISLPYQLFCDDCYTFLKTLDENSVDAIVTDPPAGVSFMGKVWDGDKGGRDGWIAWLGMIMRECCRVLKPGGHMLCWALPRTSHWTGMAIEDGGFFVRDTLHHCFGTGFPKSLNISKAIDKRAGAEREVLEEWYTGYSGTLGGKGAYSGLQGDDIRTISVPSTPEAKQWDGWGTALKPSHELWFLAQKKLDGSFVENVLKWGTGALNIDACRIGTSGGLTRHTSCEAQTDCWEGNKATGEVTFSGGRFPSNMALSHSLDCSEHVCAEGCPVRLMGEQSGQSQSAARFFLNLPADPFVYVAKASQADKSNGLNGERNSHPTVKSSHLMAYFCRLITPPSGTILDPFVGSGSTGIGAIKEGFRFVGIEKSLEYFDIADERLFAALQAEL